MPAFIVLVSFYLCLGRIDADALALLGCLFEPYLYVDKSKQGVIAAYSNITSSFDDGTALANQDRACLDDRTVATLDAESLALAVATVVRATNALFMCHTGLCLLLGLDCAGFFCGSGLFDDGRGLFGRTRGGGRRASAPSRRRGLWLGHFDRRGQA